MYSDLPISEEIIMEIVENANWAPTHKRTEPWRFKIFHSLESRQKLADFIADDFKSSTPADKFSEIKMNEASEKPLQSGCTIAICMQRDPLASLPEWEEIAAVACAVQNMWLTCTAYHIGSYWASPGFIKRLGPILRLNEGEQCLGLFYMGRLKEGATAPALRNPIDEKIMWMS
jgi:nitroreductase